MSAQLSIGVCCDRGVGPRFGGRAHNEDNFLVCRGGQARYFDSGDEVVRAVQGSGIMAAVADGMGGHQHGAIASAAAVQSLVRLYEQGAAPDMERALLRFMQRAHGRLRARALRRGVANMGTTLTAVWIRRGRAAWAHVGDSRLYLLRAGGLHQLTRDHTRGEFARRDGEPVPDNAQALTQNFIFGSRGLRDDAAIRMDRGRDTGAVELAPGDRLLLTSDGVHGPVGDAQISEILTRVVDPLAAATALAEQAMSNGGEDNLTAVVIGVQDVVRGDLDAEDWALWEQGKKASPGEGGFGTAG